MDWSVLDVSAKPTTHSKLCEEFPSLFPLPRGQGYQRGLVMWGSVCPKSESCDFQALTFQYLPAWMHSLGRCSGHLCLCLGGYCCNSSSFGFTWCSPTTCPKGLGKTGADPSPALTFPSPPLRIMHDEVSETENIRKNLAIERMIIEGCEILLDTSQTFVRQGQCRCQPPCAGGPRGPVLCALAKFKNIPQF